jgi:hypothetical protein
MQFTVSKFPFASHLPASSFLSVGDQTLNDFRSSVDLWIHDCRRQTPSVRLSVSLDHHPEPPIGKKSPLVGSMAVFFVIFTGCWGEEPTAHAVHRPSEEAFRMAYFSTSGQEPA